MAARTVTIECPNCASTLEPGIGGPDRSPTGDPRETIHGRELRCRYCDQEFDLLYYPE